MTATAAQIKKEAIPVNKCPICTATIPPNAPVCEMCGEYEVGKGVNVLAKGEADNG